MTPLMNLFLRCFGALLLIFVIWSISDYANAQVPTGTAPPALTLHDAH